MHTKHKTVTMTGIKTAGLADGEFIGWASTFGNTDSQGDRVMPGAFAKSIDAMASGQVTPILWEHQRKDPRAFVGEIKSARETDEGLEIHAKLDLDSPEGQAAYRQVKARRVGALSIGYGVRNATKAADGVQELTDLDLMEVSLVVRPANDRAVITASKTGDTSAIVLARKALANMTKAADDTEDPDPDADAATEDLTVGERLLASLQAATDAAQELIDTAESEDRDLTEEETAEVVKALERAKGTKREIQRWADMDPSARWGLQYLQDVPGGKTSDAEFRAKFGDQDTAEKFQTFDATGVGVKTKRHKKTQETIVADKEQFISIGAGRKAAAATIASKMAGGARAWGTGDAGEVTGSKALTTGGQVTTDVPMMPGVVPTGRPAVSLLDVIPTPPRTTPTYRYIRQASRALAAAAVAPGAVKPASSIGTETIDNQVSVIAHLSEPLDKFVLSDNGTLARFVQEEMLYGLDVAIQASYSAGRAPRRTSAASSTPRESKSRRSPPTSSPRSVRPSPRPRPSAMSRASW